MPGTLGALPIIPEITSAMLGIQETTFVVDSSTHQRFAHHGTHVKQSAMGLPITFYPGTAQDLPITQLTAPNGQPLLLVARHATHSILGFSSL